MSTKETTTGHPIKRGQWRVLDGAIITDEINDYGNFIVCAIERERTKQDDERLALIVRAVNAHGELVSALVSLTAWCESNPIEQAALEHAARYAECKCGALEGRLIAARAAIAKAEGAL